MPAPSHILVAYDFSDPARRALDLAHELRARLHAAVDVVHVHADPFAGTPGEDADSLWATEEQIQEHLEVVSEHLKRVVDEVFGPNGTAVRCEVVRGDIVKELLAAVERRGADLLVMGTTGKHGLARILLGSVAEKVVRTCPIPVLTVS